MAIFRRVFLRVSSSCYGRLWSSLLQILPLYPVCHPFCWIHSSVPFRGGGAVAGGGFGLMNLFVCWTSFFCHGFLTCARTCSRLMYGIPLARDVYDGIALDIIWCLPFFLASVSGFLGGIDAWAGKNVCSLFLSEGVYVCFCMACYEQHFFLGVCLPSVVWIRVSTWAPIFLVQIDAIWVYGLHKDSVFCDFEHMSYWMWTRGLACKCVKTIPYPHYEGRNCLLWG